MYTERERERDREIERDRQIERERETARLENLASLTSWPCSRSELLVFDIDRQIQDTKTTARTSVGI